MKTVRHLNLGAGENELAPGSVILVDTDDGKTHKVIIQEGGDRFDIANSLIAIDIDQNTEERKYSVISTIQVGKPMSIVIVSDDIHEQGKDMMQYTTQKVTSIEIYS